MWRDETGFRRDIAEKKGNIYRIEVFFGLCLCSLVYPVDVPEKEKERNERKKLSWRIKS